MSAGAGIRHHIVRLASAAAGRGRVRDAGPVPSGRVLRCLAWPNCATPTPAGSIPPRRSPATWCAIPTGGSRTPIPRQTRAWLAAQDALFAGYAAALPGRDALAARIAELVRAGTVSPPVWRADRRFFLRRTPDQDHAVLFTAVRRRPPAGRRGNAAPPAERVLIDPMGIDPSGLTTLDAWQPDKEGQLLAYQLSEGGDEESVLRVMDVPAGQDVDGPIDRCRYSVVAWLPGTSASRGPAGKAFYYVRRLPPEAVPGGRGAVPPPGIPAPGRHSRLGRRHDLR